MNQAQLQTISCEDLHQKLTTGEDIVLVDVRSPQEHADFNIGGKLIPLSELQIRAGELNSEDDIVVYCLSGMRSASAVEILNSMNFNSVRSLAGGLKAWQAVSG